MYKITLKGEKNIILEFLTIRKSRQLTFFYKKFLRMIIDTCIENDFLSKHYLPKNTHLMK